MSLRNLNQLATDAQEAFNSYQKQEIILTTEFKQGFSNLLAEKSSEKISYSKFTSVIETSSNLTITFPNQWFFIASYFVDFLTELKEYKRNYNSIFQGQSDAKEIVKRIKEGEAIPNNIETKINNHFTDQTDKAFFKKFLSDYSWWFGNKTIDRGDYFVSPVLNLSKVVNVSQAYIADLAFLLSEEPSLLSSLKRSTISQVNTSTLSTSDNNFNYNVFYENAIASNLVLDRKLCIRFISSLLTKPFVILTGLSGSGKTKLAQAFAMWVCEQDKQYCMVPVGADWTNREPLLGFPNALTANEYVKPDNRVLDLIIDANKNPNKPYFLILDEMNLSHVERYFADFLSIMESKEKISLHSGNTDWNEVPPEIGFPKNLFIIGTVNIDETTYMFSPKVLDRASVIEFRVNAAEMEIYLGSNSQINFDDLKTAGKNMAESFVELAKDTKLEATDADTLNKILMSFFAELKKAGTEFGYRSASEIIRFAAVANKLDASWSSTEIADAAIMQKLLPKVHGSQRKLGPILKTLGALCLQDGQKIEDYVLKSEIDFADRTKIKYPVSLEKILRMYQSLISNGFTSYAEA